MKRSLAVLALFLLLAVIFTYPLIFNLATRAPAGEAWTYDGFSMIWNVWWFKHALLELNANPFFTNSIFAPLGASLYLHSYTVFSDLIALPLLAWLSPVTASNILLIASLALCGYGAHLLAAFVLAEPHSQFVNRKSQFGPFVAGLVFAFTTSRFVFLAQGHYNFFTTEWLPFYLLYLLKSLRKPTRRNIAMAALFLTMTLLVELSLGVMLVLVTGLYWLLTLRRPYPQTLKRLSVCVAIFIVAALLASPYLLPTLRESFDPKYIPQYWGGAPVLSTDVVGMFTPSSLSTFFGTHDWPREWQQVLLNQSRFVGLNTFVIGFGVLGVALLGAIVTRRVRVWLWLALALVVLSWGPLLHINGQKIFDLDGMKVTVGLPYIALHYIPLLNGLRAPQRFAAVATLCFAVLVGYATVWLLARGGPWRRVLLTGSVIVIVTVEHITLPVPMHDATIPTVYERIARESGDFTVMDIPLGWRSGFGPVGTENTQLQYYQVAHGKRLISGFVARTPSFVFDYFKRQPTLNAIAQLESVGRLPAGDTARDPILAAELAYFFDLRYIVVHPPASAPTPYDATMQRVHDYIRDVFDLDEVEQRDGITVYRVNQSEPRTSVRVDFGTSASSLNRAEGWGDDELVGGATANWLIGREARVFVPLRMVGNYRLTLRAAPFAYPNHPAQTLTVRVNGKLVGQPIRMADEWREYVGDVSAQDIQSGLNEIVLEASSSAVPADVLPASDDKRQLSVAVDWIGVDIQ